MTMSKYLYSSNVYIKAVIYLYSNSNANIPIKAE